MKVLLELDTVMNPWLKRLEGFPDVGDVIAQEAFTHPALREELNTLLSIGYSVTCISSRETKEAPVPRPPTTLSSYQIGKQAEDQLEQLITTAFPDDQVINNAQRHHESDLVLKFGTGEILVESKHYASVVPIKEVTKFHADLQRTGVNYGVFVSFGQSIGGKPNKKLVYECKDNKHVIYIPAYAPNPPETRHLDPVVVALNLLRATSLSMLESRGHVAGALTEQFIHDTTDELATNLHDSLSMLEDHLRSLNRKRYDIAKNQDDLVNHVIQSRNFVFEQLLQLYDNEKQVIEQLSLDVNMQIDKLRGMDTSTWTTVVPSMHAEVQIKMQQKFPKNKKISWMLNELFSLQISLSQNSSTSFVINPVPSSVYDKWSGSLMMKVTATAVKIVEMNEHEGNPERTFKDQANFSSYLQRYVTNDQDFSK